MTTTDPDLDTAGPTAAGTGDVPPAGGTAAPGSAAPPPSRPRRRRRRGWAALGRLGLVVVLLAVAVAASAVLVVSTRENPATGLGPAPDIGALQVASLEADDPRERPLPLLDRDRPRPAAGDPRPGRRYTGRGRNAGRGPPERARADVAQWPPRWPPGSTSPPARWWPTARPRCACTPPCPAVTCRG